MGSIQKIDRPKPWRARYRGPDGHQHSKSFRRKVDAERWLLTEENAALTGSWVDPKAGTVLLGEYAEAWLEARQVWHRRRSPPMRPWSALTSSRRSAAGLCERCPPKRSGPGRPAYWRMVYQRRR